MDYYEILQVDRRADLEVIRAAYRVLARRHHPDVGGNPQQMSAVNEAWATLGDAAKRARYDAAAKRAAATAAAAAAAAAAASANAATMAHAAPAPAAPPRGVGVMQPEVATYEPSPRPVGHPSGPGVLDFGRYAGWSVDELSRHDPNYLLWLERTPIGRSLRSEIQRAMELRRGSVATAEPRRPVAASRGRLFGRF